MKAAAAGLPAAPGVYRFRDGAGRVLYLGRAVNLRRRVRSYWADLGDRQHLAAMVARIARVEAVACASEHEAAWLERNLLERQLPPWNRTPGGQEVAVCIRLNSSARSPGLTVLHSEGNGADLAAAHAGARLFGPYLGGARVRLAVAGLHRIFPVGYAGDGQSGALGDLARRRGVGPPDRGALVQAVTAVLERDPAAAADLQLRLAQRRDAAAAVQAYELAGRIQAELSAAEWITCEQRAASLDAGHADLAGWTDGVLVRFDIRGGRVCAWRQFSRTAAQAQRWLAATPPAWRDFATQNARLAARLSSATAGRTGVAPVTALPAGRNRRPKSSARLPADEPVSHLYRPQLDFLGMSRPRVLSGIQPTADSFHIGNYLGALRQWVALQDTHDTVYCVVDLHAITVPQNPAELRRRTRVAAAQLFAAGLDPDRSIVFVQSHVPEHAELAWVLSCLTGFGEASRMVQFKDKSAKGGADASSVGLFTYPILQAADILLYDADQVPVGEDQRQHLELTRDLAQRFNHRFGKTFVVPGPYILAEVAKITDLQDPSIKMSKSASSPQGIIDVLEEPAAIRRKIMRAVTDVDGEVREDEAAKPGVTNLLRIYSALAGEPVADLEQRYAGAGYGTFKKDLAEVVVSAFAPIRERTEKLLANEAELDKLLAAGAARAREVALATMARVRDKVGFLPAG